MKMFIAILVLGFSVTQSQAETKWVVNDQGEMRQVETEPVWQDATAEQVKAREQPNVPVPVYGTAKWQKVDFFHHVAVQMSDHSVVYRDGKLEKLAITDEIRGEPQFRRELLFLLAAIVLMVASNIFSYKRNCPAAFTFVFAFVTLFIAIDGNVAAAAAVVVVISLALAGVLDNKVVYRISSVLFYGLSLWAILSY